MSPDDIVRAWKDPDYFGIDPDASHPAGEIALYHGGSALSADTIDHEGSIFCTWVPHNPQCWPFTSTC